MFLTMTQDLGPVNMQSLQGFTVLEQNMSYRSALTPALGLTIVIEAVLTLTLTSSLAATV